MADLILSLGAIGTFCIVLGVVGFISDYVIPKIPFLDEWFERHNTSPEIDE